MMLKYHFNKPQKFLHTCEESVLYIYRLNKVDNSHKMKVIDQLLYVVFHPLISVV